MLAYEYVLQGTKGLFLASEDVSREDFNKYINSLSLDIMFPGIQGVGYSVIVPKDQKDNFTATIRSEGFPEFRITPDIKREVYTSIIYLEPFNARNKRAFGYDMYSNPVRRAAMQQSRDENMAVISGKIRLLQEYDNEAQAGFLMYLPLFKKDKLNLTVEQRRQNILGWIYAPFRMNDLMHGLFQYENNQFDIEIYDNGTINDKNLMYDSYKQKRIALFSRTLYLDIVGRKWALVIRSTPEFENKLNDTIAYLVLVFGFIFSIALAAIVWQLMNTKEYAQRKAKMMNKQLIDSKDMLQELNDTLEKRVEQKTQELQRSNEILEEHIGDLNVLNHQLIRAKEEALQAAQAKSNFISGVSHELRTPLNAIINFTDQIVEDFDEMLQDKELQEDHKEYLTRVIANSTHLLQLINDLLEFTKAEAGKIDYNIEKNDINTIAKMAYNSTFSLLNGTNVEFRMNLWDKPLEGMVDTRRFLQVLLNLLSNAVKFTKEGYIELRTYREGEEIVVDIEDTGRGIALEKQKLIFEPFMQVNNTDEGTGLGLGLAKRMCRDMNIQISLKSEAGKGSIFSLRFKAEEE